MPKLKYNDGTGFKQIVPTKEEFDDLKNTTTTHLAEKATQTKLGHIRLPPASVTLEGINGWVQGTTNLRIYKDDLGRVYIDGELKDGTATNGTAIAIIPEQFRPRRNVFFTGIKANDQTLFNITIYASTGEVQILGLNSTGTIRMNVNFEGVR